MALQDINHVTVQMAEELSSLTLSTVPIVPLAKGDFPAEVKLVILEYLAQGNIISIARIMLASKSWYSVVKGDVLGWKRRTLEQEQLARAFLVKTVEHKAEDKQPIAGDWFSLWLQTYQTACLCCKLDLKTYHKAPSYAIATGFVPPIYPIPFEPRRCQVCSSCSSTPKFAWRYVQDYPFHHLHPDELLPILFVNRRNGKQCCTLADLRLLETKKLHQRKMEIQSLLLLSNHKPGQKEDYGDAMDPLQSNDRLLPMQPIRSAYEAILSSAKPPSPSAVAELIDICCKWYAVPDTILALFPRSARSLQTVLGALEWRYIEKEPQTGRGQEINWRDSLTTGAKTVEEFLAYIASPDAGCKSRVCVSCKGMAAKKCENKKCGKCCSGCEHHETAYSDYDYGYRGGDYDDGDGYNSF